MNFSLLKDRYRASLDEYQFLLKTSFQNFDSKGSKNWKVAQAPRGVAMESFTLKHTLTYQRSKWFKYLGARKTPCVTLLQPLGTWWRKFSLIKHWDINASPSFLSNVIFWRRKILYPGVSFLTGSTLHLVNSVDVCHQCLTSSKN